MAEPTPQDEDIVAEVLEFFQDREGAENDNRQAMSDDLRFCYVPGAQWEELARAKRQGRPCYSYNRVAGAVNQAIGDQRQSRPSGRVRPVNKEASRETAETFGGLIRNIESSSSAETIYDEAFKYAVAGAWGAWRVVPEYCDDDSFDQELRIKRIANPQTVYFDENADPYGRGSMKCVVAERISIDKYKAEFGEEMYTDLPVTRDNQGWFGDTEVRIAEYYRMDCRTEEIAQLSDGRTMPKDKALTDELEAMAAAGLEAPTIERTRKVQRWFCAWHKVDGSHILEGPIEYQYTRIPVIRVPGRYVNIEGEQYFQSLIRHSKDAQRTYNYERSTMVEAVALTPRAPYIGTPAMFKGLEDQWKQANVTSAPYLEANADPKVAGLLPKREPPPDVPQALIALAAQSAEDIKQTTGRVNPALDQPQMQGPESGVALRHRAMTGDAGSYEFLDNFAKAIQFTWEVLIDMIPVTYDNERIVRILGEDGKEDHVTINGKGDDGIVRRLSEGKYDVTVTLGPAYATARLEALDTLLEAAQAMPIIYEEAPDLIVKNMDVQGADEIERRIRRRLIKEGKVEPTKEEKADMGPPPPPAPEQVALVNRLNAETARDQAETAAKNVDTAAKMAKADTDLRHDQLEVEKMVKEIAHQQAETMLLIKQLIEQRPDKTTVTASL